jgi:hypothetical protein
VLDTDSSSLGSATFGQSALDSLTPGQKALPVRVTRDSSLFNVGNVNLLVEGGRQYTLIAIGLSSTGVSQPLTDPMGSKYAILLDDGKQFDSPLPAPGGGGSSTPSPGGSSGPTATPPTSACRVGSEGCACDGGACDGALECENRVCVEVDALSPTGDSSSDDG